VRGGHGATHLPHHTDPTAFLLQSLYGIQQLMHAHKPVINNTYKHAIEADSILTHATFACVANWQIKSNRYTAYMFVSCYYFLFFSEKGILFVISGMHAMTHHAELSACRLFWEMVSLSRETVCWRWTMTLYWRPLEASPDP
jgi:hypothetical protein